MSRYTYWINFNKAVPSWTEFFPNEEAQAINKQPSDREFYRENVEEIKINRKRGDKDNSTVYDLLESWFTDKTKFNDEIEIEIYRGTRSGTLYYAGFFSISDTSLDNEYKTFAVTPRIDDDYRDIVDIAETDFDVLDNSVFSEDIIVGEFDALGAWSAGSPNATFNDFDTFTGSGGSLGPVIDSDAGNTEARFRDLGAVTNMKKVVIKILSFTLNAGTGPYFDIFSNADASITDEGAQQVTAAGTLEFTINSSENGNLVLHTTPANQTTNFSMSFQVIKEGDLNLNDAALFMDFIEKFITHIALMNISGFAGKVKSTFINNDALPSDAPSSIVSFMTTNPNGNYVTGIVVTNKLNGFLISETQEWVTASITDNTVNFNNIMDDLKEVIQAGWYIDADGDFRIEHIKYFEKLWDDSTAIDLTSAPFSKYKPNIDNNELSFSKGLLANREQFTWQQGDTVINSEDFVGVDIIYDNLETVSNVLKHETRSITTDIQYLVDNPGDAGSSGFVYLYGLVLDSGDYLIEFELGELSATQILNGHFSWANLHQKYWSWRRMAEDATLNNSAETFDSVVKFLEQSNVKFGIQTTVDGFTKITTSQGNGRQIETKRDLDSDFLTITLGYDPYE